MAQHGGGKSEGVSLGGATPTTDSSSLRLAANAAARQPAWRAPASARRQAGQAPQVLVNT
jgi:hypothetical protein